MNCILVIAHAPLAAALRAGALHVFPDAGAQIAAVDVDPEATPEQAEALARQVLAQLQCQGVLILTDLFGATPCNVAQRLLDEPGRRLLAGINLSMLLRALSYRHESLEAMAERALAGGTQGVMPVAVAAPQNQPRRAQPDHDQQRHHHQQ